MTCIHRRNGATTHTDAVVVATHKHNLLVGLGSSLYGIALVGKTNSTGKHDDFVVGKLVAIFLVLKSEERTADERLTELVSEIGGTIRSLDENLLGSLVKPWARWHSAKLPLALGSSARIRRHIDGSTGKRKTCTATAQTVADFTTRTCGSTVERLHGGGEVVCLSLE